MGNQKARLLVMLDILKTKSDEEHPLTSSDIIKQLALRGFECERKTVYTDIEALDCFGLEVIYTTSPKKGYFLATRDFEPSEIALLTDAVVSADFITLKKTEQLVKKLRGFLSDFQAVEQQKKTFISARKKGENEEIFYNIDKIRTAILKGKKITFSYFKHILKGGHFIEPSSKEMKVSPYALVWEDDRYYLICNYEKYDNLLHLRLDRMKKITVTDEPYRHFSLVSEYKNEFDVSDYVEKTFQMFSGVETVVQLKCDVSTLEQVVDRFGDDIFVRSVDEEHFVFDTKVYFSEGFVSWLVSVGDKIEILKPADLRNKVKSAAELVAEKYK